MAYAGTNCCYVEQLSSIGKFHINFRHLSRTSDMVVNTVWVDPALQTSDAASTGTKCCQRTPSWLCNEVSNLHTDCLQTVVRLSQLLRPCQ